jgi:hypothetical protein
MHGLLLGVTVSIKPLRFAALVVGALEMQDKTLVLVFVVMVALGLGLAFWGRRRTPSPPLDLVPLPWYKRVLFWLLAIVMAILFMNLRLTAGLVDALINYVRFHVIH